MSDFSLGTTAKKKPLRVGLIGCGQIADAHLQEISAIPDALIVGVCDREPDLAYQAAVRFSVQEVFSDLPEMLEKAKPDVLHLTTPPHTHEGIAVLAMQQGCHVYVEKPFSSDAAEAERILREAQRASRLVCVGLDQLWEPVWASLRALVRSGELGSIVHIDSYQGYDLSGPYGRALKADPDHWVHRLPGGLFQNVMPHALAKITDLMPDEHPAVGAFWSGSSATQPFESELRVLLKGRAQSATLTFCSAGRPVKRVTRVIGTKGSVDVDFDSRSLRRAFHPSMPGAFAPVQLAGLQLAASARDLRDVLGRFRRREIQYFGGMRRLFMEFYAAVRGEKACPQTPSEILRDVRIMDRIFAECRSGSFDRAQVTGGVIA